MIKNIFLVHIANLLLGIGISTPPLPPQPPPPPLFLACCPSPGFLDNPPIYWGFFNPPPLNSDFSANSQNIKLFRLSSHLIF